MLKILKFNLLFIKNIKLSLIYLFKNTQVNVQFISK